jgi:A/G-specific adenine glycosylase
MQHLKFSVQLIRWQRVHGRHQLPWQNTNDPYAIWLSEIMLQQTRVATVIPYYLKFLRCYPDVKSLSLASLDEVLALWSGLGYYSRGRNLHKTACLIVSDHHGKFPRKIKLIQQLPGIGRSTAAAIVVFAYGKQCAILDGNVKRVLARHFGVESYPGEKKTEALLWKKAEELLPKNNIKGNIKAYSQALMDLGATICTSTKPKCVVCPIRRECVAFQEDREDELPIPRPYKPLVIKETVMLMIMRRGEILLERRPPMGIWGGLWCLPEIPTSGNISLYCAQRFGIKIQLLGHIPSIDHPFTHFKLRIYPRSLKVVSQVPAISQSGRKWISFNGALEMGIPTPVRNLLNSNYSYR